MVEVSKIKLSIIVPAYNEAEVIEKTLSGLEGAVTTPHEIIVVQDHCTDTTPDIVSNFGIMHPNVRLVSNMGNKGFGNAIQSGFRAAHGETVVTVMADLCDDPSTIDRMYNKLVESNSDLVCASRYMRGGRKISGPRIQGALSSLVSRSMRVIIGIPTWDIANSFKLYKKNFLDSINYKIKDAGTDYSMRLAARAYFAGAKITEIPTTWRGKSVSFWQEFKIFKRTKQYAGAYSLALVAKIKNFKKEVIFFGFFTILHLFSVLFIYFQNIGVSPIQDALEYRMLGINLLAGHGFSIFPSAPYFLDMLRVPSYPIFLALTYFIEKSGLLAVTIQQIFVIISGILLFKIFEQYNKKNIGFIFAALFLLEPVQWMLSLQTMSEAFYSFFMLVGLYCLISEKLTQKESRGFWREFLAGLFVAIATLARPVGILWLPGFITLVFFGRVENWKKRFARLGVFGGAFLILVMPWLIRNYVIVGKPVLSSSYEYNIIIGFGDRQEIFDLQRGPEIYDTKGRKGAAMIGFTAKDYPRISLVADDIIEREGRLSVVVGQMLCSKKIWFRSQYDTILDMVYKGAGNGFFAGLVNFLDNVFWVVILLLSILGLWEFYKSTNVVYVAAVSLILFVNIFVNLCISYTRMRVPLLPIIFLLSGFGLWYLYSGVREFYNHKHSAE